MVDAVKGKAPVKAAAPAKAAAPSGGEKRKHAEPKAAHKGKAHAKAAPAAKKVQKKPSDKKRASLPKRIKVNLRKVGAVKSAVKKPIGKGRSVIVTRPRLPRRFPPPRPAGARPHKSAKPKLRKSLTPGTVLIILAGRFRGRRVVFLKQLESGLLLITGPFRINGVPIRRVNQRYVIATSTKIDISAVKVDEKIDDKYFIKHRVKKSIKNERKFFSNRVLKGMGRKTPKSVLDLPQSRVDDQKNLDTPILAKVKTVPYLRNYLSTAFSLKKNQYPHLLKF